MDEKAKEWTLKELAAETGVPERTIRFYISRGLVDPPLRGGRGAAYGAGHKARLEEIRKLQAKGLMLVEIAHVLAQGSNGLLLGRAPLTKRLEEPGPEFRMFKVEPFDRSVEVAKEEELTLAEKPAPAHAAPTASPVQSAVRSLPAPEEWRAYGVAGDAVVMLRAGAAPWRTRRLMAALRQFQAMINDTNTGNDPKEGDDE